MKCGDMMWHEVTMNGVMSKVSPERCRRATPDEALAIPVTDELRMMEEAMNQGPVQVSDATTTRDEWDPDDDRWYYDWHPYQQDPNDGRTP